MKIKMIIPTQYPHIAFNKISEFKDFTLTISEQFVKTRVLFQVENRTFFAYPEFSKDFIIDSVFEDGLKSICANVYEKIKKNESKNKI